MDIETAIEWQKTFKSGFLGITDEACDFTITALEELQQYRQIGTVDECRVTMDELIELQEYRKLGTVKECWEARKKQIAKTPDYGGDGYADGELVYDTWICPNCGEHYEIEYDDYEYCPNCGQHIKHEDWERE